MVEATAGETPPNENLSLDQKVEKIVQAAMDEVDYLAQKNEILPLSPNERRKLEENYRLNVHHTLAHTLSDQSNSGKYLSICANATIVVKDENGRVGGVEVEIGSNGTKRDMIVVKPDNETAARIDMDAPTAVFIKPFDCLR